MNRGPWRAIVRGVTKESDMTEHTRACAHTQTHTRAHTHTRGSKIPHAAWCSQKKEKTKGKIQTKRKVRQAGDKRIPRKRKMPLNP